MARGVSFSDDGTCDGDAFCGGGGGCRVCEKGCTSQDHGSSSPGSSSFIEPLDIQGKSSSTNSKYDMGDIFFGRDDMKDMKDLACKEEDILGYYRREKAIKSIRKKRTGWFSVAGCFEFLKLFRFF